MFDIFESLCDFLTAGDFTRADIAGAVFENDYVACEKRRVRTAEVQLHAVMPCNRVNVHFYYLRDHKNFSFWIKFYLFDGLMKKFYHIKKFHKKTDRIFDLFLSEKNFGKLIYFLAGRAFAAFAGLAGFAGLRA